MEGKNLPVEHCIIGTEGWGIHKDLIKDDDIVVSKVTFGYGDWRGFFDKHDIIPSEIELCGVCTDICVISNALILKAEYIDIPFTVDASCCAGVTPKKHKAALEVMKSCQIHVVNE